MKQIIFLSVVTISIFLCSFTGNAQDKSFEDPANKNIIEVFDFHTTNRCVTCKSIESNTKYTLDTYFADEVKSGKITFSVVNIDEKENEKLAEKFEASGTSLFLNVIKNGKEKQINLTEFAFMNGKKQETFSKELKTKIEKELKTL